MKIIDNKGFTLVDLSIALVVLGLLAVPVLQQYNQYIQNKAYSDTSASQIAIKGALDEFYLEGGRYPCPADPTLTEADSGYGEEDCAGVLSVPAFDTAGNPIDRYGGGQDNVLIGAIPFDTLKIEEKHTFDGYTNKFTYVVSEILTNVATYDPMDATPDGAVAVNGFSMVEDPPSSGIFVRVPVTVQPGDAHYIVVSHGALGIGGYSSTGIPIDVCPVGAAETAESENCDNDNVFFSEQYAKSAVAGSNYYDDQTFTVGSFPERTWTYSEGNKNSISSLRSRSFGINTDAPDIRVYLDVNGNILVIDDAATPLVSEGDIHAAKICVSDPGSTNCFSPDVIGGTGISCGAGAGMTGVAYGNTKCDVPYVSALPGTCPAGEYMTGLDAGGNIVCAAP